MFTEHSIPRRPSLRPYPGVKDRSRPVPWFHRARPQTSKHLSPPQRSEGDYTSLRSIQASGGTKSTLPKSRIHQDPDCAELCAGPAFATGRFSPSPTEGANRRNLHRVGMGYSTSAIPGTTLREETQGKDRDSRTSGRKSRPIRLNQRCGGLSALPSHESLSS
jgi:hypothetical protein